MANLNKVMLIGNLTRDPEVKYTPKGTAIAEIGLAVNRVYTTPQGEKKEEVTFIDVELWERLAELAGQYLKKGRPVFIEGRLRLDSWDDKTSGQKRTKLKVRAEVMQFLGSRGDSEGGSDAEGGESRSPRRSGGSAGHASASEDDYDQRPSTRPAQQPSGNKPKPRPAPAEDLEEDDIPF
ncbi:MAG: single-stranded DNA-binding protein [Verrucomicrobia bacterium]|nr:single-stranded DNA-binding protein [Verrucomicrobiota bacterium]